MVSVIWAAIAASTGVLVYLGIPFVASQASIHTRHRVGAFYLKLAARCLKQWAFVRRILSGYDVLPITVDDESKRLSVTLSSSLIGSDNTYPFVDPDNRIHRLWNKPVALTYEGVPAALDAELSEAGHWTREKDTNEGLWHGDLDDPKSVTVDPYVPVSDDLRLVDPIDAYELVPNAVSPENVKTAEQLTRKRFEKYGPRIGLTETVSTIIGFITGVGAVAGLWYIKVNLLANQGGNSPIDTIPFSVVSPGHVVDVVGVLA